MLNIAKVILSKILVKPEVLKKLRRNRFTLSLFMDEALTGERY